MTVVQELSLDEELELILASRWEIAPSFDWDAKRVIAPPTSTSTVNWDITALAQLTGLLLYRDGTYLKTTEIGTVVTLRPGDHLTLTYTLLLA